MNKKLPTIDIKGKAYTLVKDRILDFNESYPNGSIQTSIVSHDGGLWIIKAKVTPDMTKPERYFTDYAQADESQSDINKTAGLENASTSAVGRALAYMGIGVIESVASADEMAKAGVPMAKQPAPKSVGGLATLECPKHHISVPGRISNNTGKPYWICNGEKPAHFLDDPNKVFEDAKLPINNDAPDIHGDIDF